MDDKIDNVNNIDDGEYVITIDSTLDAMNYTIDMSTASSYNYATLPGNVTISGASGSSGSFLYSTAGMNGTAWSTVTSTNPGLHVKDDATFEGDIKWKGRSLGKLLQSIEDRLAILQEPSPEKLEKYAALKKAYDHYKTLERLIGED
jgi:hypothetical protein